MEEKRSKLFTRTRQPNLKGDNVVLYRYRIEYKRVWNLEEDDISIVWISWTSNIKDMSKENVGESKGKEYWMNRELVVVQWSPKNHWYEEYVLKFGKTVKARTNLENILQLRRIKINK